MDDEVVQTSVLAQGQVDSLTPVSQLTPHPKGDRATDVALELRASPHATKIKKELKEFEWLNNRLDLFIGKTLGGQAIPHEYLAIYENHLHLLAEVKDQWSKRVDEVQLKNKSLNEHNQQLQTQNRTIRDILKELQQELDDQKKAALN